MGVKDLWKLLESAGRPVTLESLEGVVLAIDVSIWLNQAVKGSRGEENAHLTVLFHRICKLLHYHIRPVFVFDGVMPALKQQTLAARSKRRDKASQKSLRTADKQLSKFLQAKILEQMTGERSTVPLPMKSQPDLFELPPLPEEQQERNPVKSPSPGVDPSYLQEVASLDVNSEEFGSLPPEVQHELLMERQMMEKYSYSDPATLPQVAGDFSSYQLSKLVKRSRISLKLDDVRKVLKSNEMVIVGLGDESKVHEVETSRIMSSDSAHYILVRGEDMESSNQDEGVEWGMEESELEEWESDKTKERRGWSGHSEGERSSLKEGIGILKEGVLAAKGRSESEVEGVSLWMKEGSTLNVGESTVDLRSEGGVGRKASCLKEGSTLNESTPSGNSSREMAKDVVGKPMRFESENLLEGDVSITEAVDSDLRKKQSLTGVDGRREDERVVHAGDSDVKGEESLTGVDGRREDEERVVHEVIEVPETSANDQVKTIGEARMVAVTGPKGIGGEEVIGETLGEWRLVTGPEGGEGVLGTRRVSGGSLTATGQDGREEGDSVERCSEVAPEITVMSDSSESDSEPQPDELEPRLVGMGSGPVGMEPGPVGMESGPVVMEPGPVGMESGPVGMEPGPVGMEPGPVGMEPRPVGMESGPVGMEPGPVGMESGQDWQDVFQVSPSEAQSRLRSEVMELERERAQQSRAAATVSNLMYIEAQELLSLFGLPYLISPSEAEAQCAALETAGMTEGTITDDSDVFLFGGKRVYRHFFNQEKHVECYNAKEILHRLGLSRLHLITVAYLLGSDYTDGLEGVGVVSAMEFLREFPGEGIEPLRKFRRWYTEVNSTPALRMGESSLQKKLRQLSLPTDFPDDDVEKAYLSPDVDHSTEPFEWGRPDLDLIRKFSFDRMHWSQSKVDSTLLPLLKQMNSRETQLKLTQFFPTAVLPPSPQKAIRSKRIRNVVARLTNTGDDDGSTHRPSSRGKQRGRGRGKSSSKKRKISSSGSSSDGDVREANTTHDKETSSREQPEAVSDSASMRDKGKRGRGRGQPTGVGTRSALSASSSSSSSESEFDAIVKDWEPPELQSPQDQVQSKLTPKKQNTAKSRRKKMKLT